MNSWLACSGPTWRRGDLWVPKTYATRRYSWMTPPAVMPPDPEMILKGAITPS